VTQEELAWYHDKMAERLEDPSRGPSTEAHLAEIKAEINRRHELQTR
jgi:hypothetical protein